MFVNPSWGFNSIRNSLSPKSSVLGEAISMMSGSGKTSHENNFLLWGKLDDTKGIDLVAVHSRKLKSLRANVYGKSILFFNHRDESFESLRDTLFNVTPQHIRVSSSCNFPANPKEVFFISLPDEQERIIVILSDKYLSKIKNEKEKVLSHFDVVSIDEFIDLHLHTFPDINESFTLASFNLRWAGADRKKAEKLAFLFKEEFLSLEQFMINIGSATLEITPDRLESFIDKVDYIINGSVFKQIVIRIPEQVAFGLLKEDENCLELLRNEIVLTQKANKQAGVLLRTEQDFIYEYQGYAYSIPLESKSLLDGVLSQRDLHLYGTHSSPSVPEYLKSVFFAEVFRKEAFGSNDYLSGALNLRECCIDFFGEKKIAKLEEAFGVNVSALKTGKGSYCDKTKIRQGVDYADHFFYGSEARINSPEYFDRVSYHRTINNFFGSLSVSKFLNKRKIDLQYKCESSYGKPSMLGFSAFIEKDAVKNGFENRVIVLMNSQTIEEVYSGKISALKKTLIEGLIYFVGIKYHGIG